MGNPAWAGEPLASMDRDAAKHKKGVQMGFVVWAQLVIIVRRIMNSVISNPLLQKETNQ